MNWAVATVFGAGHLRPGSGTFYNNTGGDIRIDRSSNAGIYNASGTFTNAAQITIGANAGVGDYGIYNTGLFQNNTGGDIQIDRSSTAGLDNNGEDGVTEIIGVDVIEHGLWQ